MPSTRSLDLVHEIPTTADKNKYELETTLSGPRLDFLCKHIEQVNREFRIENRRIK